MIAEPTPRPFRHPGFRGVIGVAREDITPPVGIYARNWGAAVRDVAEGVHRPLNAAAITFAPTANEAPFALVSLDLGWWRSSKDEDYVRTAVLKALGLGPERVMLSFTHTHAGPVLCREDADKPGGDLIAPYLDSLREAVIRAVRRARSSAAPAAIEWAYGRCGLASNRDLQDPERPRFLSGYNPYGAPDDTLLVGRVSAGTGQCIATIVNYACHPTTLAWENRLLSPDFVGAMRDVVERNTDGAICLYLQGASGELAPREQYTADTSVADAHGRELGFAALSTLEGMLAPCSMLAFQGVVESGAPLAAWCRGPRPLPSTAAGIKVEVDLPLRPMPSVTELREQADACGDRALAERLNRKRRIREGVGDGATSEMPLWIWQIGDALVIGHPNEAYSLLQTELRRRFPQQAVVVMNVVNGHFGYLPPAGLYGSDLYPVWQTPFGAGALETLIESCDTAIRNLYRRPREV